MRRRRHILALLLFAALLFASARAESPSPRTPDDVRLRINAILSYEEDDAPDFAEMVVFDDAGGFDFCALDGERLLDGGPAGAFIRGQTDEDGRMRELSIIVRPRTVFGRAYCMQADRFSRVFLLSIFDSLSESELELLMDSYRYDIRPYRYRESDKHIGLRTRMCEIELGGELVRIEGESTHGNTISLHVSFLHDADEYTRSRTAENAWRIRRLSIAVSECEMIQTCGDCLADTGAQDSADETEALLTLAQQSAEAVCSMEYEYMHSQVVFLTDLQAMCAQLTEQTALYRAAYDAGESAAAQEAMLKICSLCAEIGALPETLY